MLRSEYNEIIKEYFDITDTDTRTYLVSIDESDQNQALTSLASKLYSSIVKKVDAIDYGEIPNSKGDITKIPNYMDMMECLETIHKLLVNFHQSTEPTDTLFETIDHMKDSKRMWEKAFFTQCDLPIVTYNNIALSIVSALSILISTSIEFIKEPSDSLFSVLLNKTGFFKSKEYLLFKDLKKFNKSYKKGEVEKAMMSLISSQQKVHEAMEVEEASVFTIVKGAIAGAGAFVIFIKWVIPLLHEIVSFLFNMKQSASDYFAVQSNLVKLNAENVKYDYAKSEDAKKKIYEKQMKIADDFKKISNALAVKIKSAEKGIEEINPSKLKLNDLELSGSSSSIF